MHIVVFADDVHFNTSAHPISSLCMHIESYAWFVPFCQIGISSKDETFYLLNFVYIRVFYHYFTDQKCFQLSRIILKFSSL